MREFLKCLREDFEDLRLRFSSPEEYARVMRQRVAEITPLFEVIREKARSAMGGFAYRDFPNGTEEIGLPNSDWTLVHDSKGFWFHSRTPGSACDEGSMLDIGNRLERFKNVLARAGVLGMLEQR